MMRRQQSTSTARIVRSGARRSSRSSITGSSTARASTRRCAPTTAAVPLRPPHAPAAPVGRAHARSTCRSTTRRMLTLDRRDDARRRLGDAAARPTSASCSRAASASSPTTSTSTPTPSIVDHRQAARCDPPRASTSDGVRIVAGRHAAQPSRLGQPDHQVEQPAEQRAGDAGGATARGAEEALMRNYRGELAECTQSNLFIVRGRRRADAAVDAGLLPGITREFLFEVGARARRSTSARSAATPTDLVGADEAFLTSTTRELVPIVSVDDRVVGSGKPGPVTQDAARRLPAARRRAHARAGADVRRQNPQDGHRSDSSCAIRSPGSDLSGSGLRVRR